MEILQPHAWPRPRGYANGVATRGRLVFLSGQVGWDESQNLVGDDFVEQAEQALRNIVTLVAVAGGKPEHLVRLNWFVADRVAYLETRKELGRVYRAIMGHHYPAMSVLFVSGLVDDGAKVEIEATAVIPESPPGADP